ncbi:unnamed protein product [Rotaria socialis]
MNNQAVGLVAVNAGRVGRKKLLGRILIIICLGLCTLLAIILYKHFNSRRPISISNTTQTTNKTEYITPTSLPDIINTMDNTLSSAPAVVSTIDPDNLDPIQHVTTGCELGNVLYSNPNMLCLNAGYVSRVGFSSIYKMGVDCHSTYLLYRDSCLNITLHIDTLLILKKILQNGKR